MWWEKSVWDSPAISALMGRTVSESVRDRSLVYWPASTSLRKRPPRMSVAISYKEISGQARFLLFKPSSMAILALSFRRCGSSCQKIRTWVSQIVSIAAPFGINRINDISGNHGAAQLQKPRAGLFDFILLRHQPGRLLPWLVICNSTPVFTFCRHKGKLLRSSVMLTRSMVISNKGYILYKKYIQNINIVLSRAKETQPGGPIVCSC